MKDLPVCLSTQDCHSPDHGGKYPKHAREDVRMSCSSKDPRVFVLNKSKAYFGLPRIIKIPH